MTLNEQTHKNFFFLRACCIFHVPNLLFITFVLHNAQKIFPCNLFNNQTCIIYTQYQKRKQKWLLHKSLSTMHEKAILCIIFYAKLLLQVIILSYKKMESVICALILPCRKYSCYAVEQVVQWCDLKLYGTHVL